MIDFQLPRGWCISRISDISIKGEQRKPSAEEVFLYIDIGSINRDSKCIESPQKLIGKDAPSRARKVINTGDILVSLTRPNLNAVALVPHELDNQIASTGLEVIKSLLVDSRYIFALTRSKDFIESISGTVQGALYPAAKSSDVQAYTFPLPPLAEQKIIADKLDTLLEKVETTKTSLEHVPEIIKFFRQSVLAAAVSGKLTEEWRLKNPTEQVRFHIKKHNANKKGLLKVRGKNDWKSEVNLFELPTNWDWIENHELAIDKSNAICAGPFGTIFKAKDFRDEGIPIIFLRHVKESGFNQTKPTFMDKEVWKEIHQDYSVFGGELLVTKLGDPPGECCIFPEEMGVAMVTPDVLKMNVDANLANKKYLKHFFNSPISKKMLAEAAFGATRLRIDIALFKLFPIPLPPLEEQNQIVHQIEELFAFADNIELRANVALERVNNLTQSILAKALRGELTADWRTSNPELISGENSAETLLKRINTVREAIKRQPKPKRSAVKKNTGSRMNKQIIKVVEALKQAGEPLSGQQLLTAAGYPNNSSTEQLEQFFLDIRDALLVEKSIMKLERDGDSQDWFALAKTSTGE
ncbi:restriction endonuclease subunit S [Salmonella enterica subsp. enterica serovar Newport]|nr:restriction endonuclease subunit S [Salmonella enterica]ELI5621241.1 restriction endonuclease subunit S [Salmonella enterica subsp. enterica serovar Newport]